MITVVPYNPAWKNIFEELRAVYTQQLGSIAHDIQHVGSTSVPGLWAKPVIDIDIVVPDAIACKQVIDALGTLGYYHVGDLGIPGREALKRDNDNVPHTVGNATWQQHNLYVCLAGCASLLNHLHLRDYLLTHTDAVNEYSALKRELAAKYPDDIDSYVEGKTAFITAILKRTGFDDVVLRGIAEQNRVK